MLTIWGPFHKSRESLDILNKAISKGIPKSIKKWQIYMTSDGINGAKAYELIFTEKGKADEALIDIIKTIKPYLDLEGFNYKIEPVFGMKDTLAVT